MSANTKPTFQLDLELLKTYLITDENASVTPGINSILSNATTSAERANIPLNTPANNSWKLDHHSTIDPDWVPQAQYYELYATMAQNIAANFGARIKDGGLLEHHTVTLASAALKLTSKKWSRQLPKLVDSLATGTFSGSVTTAVLKLHLGLLYPLERLKRVAAMVVVAEELIAKLIDPVRQEVANSVIVVDTDKIGKIKMANSARELQMLLEAAPMDGYFGTSWGKLASSGVVEFRGRQGKCDGTALEMWVRLVAALVRAAAKKESGFWEWVGTSLTPEGVLAFAGEKELAVFYAGFIEGMEVVEGRSLWGQIANGSRSSLRSSGASSSGEELSR